MRWHLVAFRYTGARQTSTPTFLSRNQLSTLQISITAYLTLQLTCSIWQRMRRRTRRKYIGNTKNLRNLAKVRVARRKCVAIKQCQTCLQFCIAGFQALLTRDDPYCQLCKAQYDKQAPYTKCRDNTTFTTLLNSTV